MTDEEHGYDKALRSYRETCERGLSVFKRKENDKSETD